MLGHILVIDDEPDQLEVVKAVLNERGFATDTAANGLEALKKVSASLPDLIIVDGNMPKMNGFSFCESLRKDAATARVPIIMLTGLVGRLSRMNGYLHGASAYLTKPFLPEELIGKIDELMNTPPPTASPQINS